MNIINLIEPSIGGIGYLVKVIVGLTSSIALGVVLFTLILKFITLPFDFLSKRSMRKNSLLMEKMRPELEKLQKQYANDKMLYNQKMQALYKKNGYSMAGACLPTILTLVVFIIAINGFTTFANYQNQQYFYDMSISYNQAYYNGFVYNGENDPFKVEDDANFEVVVDGENYIKINLKHDVLALDSVKNAADGVEIALPNSNFKVKKSTVEGAKKLSVYNPNGYVGIEYDVSNDNNLNTPELFAVAENMVGLTNGTNVYDAGEDAVAFIKDLAATYSYNTYKGLNNSFLWVKNIWVTDSPMAHPIISDYNKFVSTYGYKNTDMTGVMDKASYENLISKLDKEAKEPNGYFILVALTALSSLLMQIITSKSQKAQMELQTVDGQGAKTNKLMTWMMPIMMAVFAFTMTAAFSIYMIISSVFSVLTTILINKIIDKSLKKKMAEEVEVSSGKEVVRGRVYVKEEKPAEPKRRGRKQTKAEENRVDFLNDKKENKRLRGRIK